MRFLSLFTGIGGLDLGLERADWQCVAQVECDPYCLEVLAKHWPDVPRFTDVRTLKAEDVEAVDAIVGGFPCQPHSVAGSRQGKEDERNLWPDFLRIVRDIRPAWVIGENVPGIDSTMLADVVGDLESEGYQVEVLGLAAATVGAPHRRERRFIVANSRKSRLQGDEHSAVLAARRREQGRAAAKCGTALADRNSAGRVCQRSGGVLDRLRAALRDNANGRSGANGSERAGWPTEPGVGGELDGLPRWLDGTGPGGSWPNPPGPQADWEEPRTIISRRPPAVPR